MKTVQRGSLAELWDWEDKFGTFVGSPTGNVKRSDAEPNREVLQPFGQHRHILSNDVEIKGSIVSDGELLIDGKIEGEIYSTGKLIIGENAHIHCDIKGNAITVYGKIEGNINVSGRCELKSRCDIRGDVSASLLMIEEGATFVGRSEVIFGENAKSMRSRSPEDKAAGRGSVKATVEAVA